MRLVLRPARSASSVLWPIFLVFMRIPSHDFQSSLPLSVGDSNNPRELVPVSLRKIFVGVDARGLKVPWSQAPGCAFEEWVEYSVSMSGVDSVAAARGPREENEEDGRPVSLPLPSRPEALADGVWLCRRLLGCTG